MLDRKPFWVFQPLNLGALVGISVAGWLSMSYPAYCPELSDRVQLLIYCGMVGSAVCKALQSGMSSFFRFVCDYVRLFEAHIFLRAKLIDDRQFRALLRHLVDRHFGVHHDCELPNELGEKEV